MPSVMSFPTRIVFGRGAIRELPAELKRAGASRPLLVTDRGILQVGLLRFVTPLLERSAIAFGARPAFGTLLQVRSALRLEQTQRRVGQLFGI